MGIETAQALNRRHKILDPMHELTPEWEERLKQLGFLLQGTTCIPQNREYRYFSPAPCFNST
jgi:hypothetical protein